MKKLLSTCTIAALTTGVVAGIANAKESKPNVIIAGKGEIISYHYANKVGVNTITEKEKSRGQSFSTAGSRVDFIVAGDTNFLDGMTYDWVVSLDARMQSNYHLKTNRIRFITKYGTLLVGNHLGVDAMMPGTHSIMQGTGGFHGEYKEVVDRSDGTILATEHPLGTAVLTKATYLTPRFYGFSGKVSWTPLTHLGGKAPQPNRNRLVDAKEDPFYFHNAIVGVDFKNALECGLGIGLGATYATSSIRQAGTFAGIKFKRAHVYTLGGKIDYQGWSLGGEYQNAKKAGKLEDFDQANNIINAAVGAAGPRVRGQFNLGQSWNTAVGYKFEDHSVGVGFFQNKRKYNGDTVKADVYSATYRYKVAPGVNLSFEYNHANMKTGDNAQAFESRKADTLKVGTSVNNNEANVGMIVMTLNF